VRTERLPTAIARFAFIREHPDNYDPAFEDKFAKLVGKLDPAD
jgi:hypothetical protein